MTPYELGILHAFEKLGVFNGTPSGASGYLDTQAPMEQDSANLPADQFAEMLSQLGDYKNPMQEKAKGEETVAEQLERTTAPSSFSTATQVPTDPATGKLPTNPGVY